MEAMGIDEVIKALEAHTRLYESDCKWVEQLKAAITRLERTKRLEEIIQDRCGDGKRFGLPINARNLREFLHTGKEF